MIKPNFTKLSLLLFAFSSIFISCKFAQWGKSVEDISTNLYTEYTFYADNTLTDFVTKKYVVGNTYNLPDASDKALAKALGKEGYYPKYWCFEGGASIPSNIVVDASSNPIAATIDRNEYAFYAVGWLGLPVNYTVLHMIQNADDDNYSLYRKVIKTDTAGQTVSETSLTIPGFEPHLFEFDSEIFGDGSTVFEFKYNRKTVYLSFYDDNNALDKLVDVRYGALIPVDTIPVLTKAGYVLTGWYAFDTPKTIASVPSEELQAHKISSIPERAPMNDCYYYPCFELDINDPTLASISLNELAVNSLDGSTVRGTIDYIEHFSSSTSNYESKVYIDNKYELIIKPNIVGQNVQVKLDGTVVAPKEEATQASPYFNYNLQFTKVKNNIITIYVNSTEAYTINVSQNDNIYVKASSGDYSLSGSENYPYDSIKTAVDFVQNKLHKATITVTGTVECGFVDANEAAISITEPSADITIKGDDSSGGKIELTAVSGRILSILEPTAIVTLGSKLTFEGGNAEKGCSIYNKGELTLVGCDIKNTEVSTLGTVYSDNGSKLTISNASISSGSSGTAVAAERAAVVLEGGSFEGNIVFFAPDSSSNPYNKVTISDNPAISGYCIYNYSSSSDFKNDEVITLKSAITTPIKMKFNYYSEGRTILQSYSGNDYSSSYSKFEVYNESDDNKHSLQINSDGKLGKPPIGGGVTPTNPTTNIYDLGIFESDLVRKNQSNLSFYVPKATGEIIMQECDNKTVYAKIYNASGFVATLQKTMTSTTTIINGAEVYELGFAISSISSNPGQYTVIVYIDSSGINKDITKVNLIEAKTFTIYVGVQ